MAGTTEHYGLTIWGREDEFKAPEGLNGNFLAVEAALGELSQPGAAAGRFIAQSSSAGNPMVFDLGFKPSAVIMWEESALRTWLAVMGHPAGDGSFYLTETGFACYSHGNMCSITCSYHYLALR